MNSEESDGRVLWQQYQNELKQDQERSARLKMQINRQQRQSQIVLMSIDNTLEKADIQIASSRQSVIDLQDLMQDLRDTTKDLALKICDVFTPIHRLPPSGFYYGPTAKVSNIREVGALLRKAKRIVVLTGAGISVASGIPTFRGEGGFWQGESTKEILTLKTFKENAARGWSWVSEFQALVSKGNPNINHKKLHELQQHFNGTHQQMTLVTQNIDGYHRTDKCVLEVHGNVSQMRCMAECQGTTVVAAPNQNGDVPKCEQCGSPCRPHILLFDEGYDDYLHHKKDALKAAQEADVIVVIGSTLETGLAAEIVKSAIDTYKKKTLIEINPDPVIQVGLTYTLPFKAEDVVPKLCDDLM